MIYDDFKEFLLENKLLDQFFKESAAKRIFVLSNVSNHKSKASSDRKLHRYEFLESIVRLSAQIYKNIPLEESVQKLMNDVIIPNSPQVNRKAFREKLFNDEKV